MPAPKQHHRRGNPGVGGRRRRRRRVKWNGNYARGVQGICKAFCIFASLLAVIIIGSSPYGRPLYVREGVTWPFHIVMFLSVVSWLLFTAAYVFFVTGQQADCPHVPWPTRELQFNIVMFLLALFALILEAANLWRWDFSGGFTITTSQMGAGVGGIGGGFGAFGANIPIRPGSLNSNMAMQSYCRQYPRDCSDVMALVTGINPFFGNHIFGLIMLVVLVISISIGLVHSIMMYKRFKRDYSPGGKPPKAKIQEAPLKDKVGYQIWNIRTNITNWGKETKDKLLDMIQREPDEEGEVGGVKTDPSSVGVKDQYLEEGGFYDEDEFTDYSESVKTGFISESTTQPPPGYYPESSSPSTIVKTKRYYDDDDHTRNSSRHHDDRTSRKSRPSKSTSSPRQHRSSKRRDRHTDEGGRVVDETFSPDEHYASVVV